MSANIEEQAKERPEEMARRVLEMCERIEDSNKTNHRWSGSPNQLGGGCAAAGDDDSADWSDEDCPAPVGSFRIPKNKSSPRQAWSTEEQLIHFRRAYRSLLEAHTALKVEHDSATTDLSTARSDLENVNTQLQFVMAERDKAHMDLDRSLELHDTLVKNRKLENERMAEQLRRYVKEEKKEHDRLTKQVEKLTRQKNVLRKENERLRGQMEDVTLDDVSDTVIDMEAMKDSIHCPEQEEGGGLDCSVTCSNEWSDDVSELGENTSSSSIPAKKRQSNIDSLRDVFKATGGLWMSALSLGESLSRRNLVAADATSCSASSDASVKA